MLVKLSEGLVVNAGAMLFARLAEGGSVVLVFPGPEHESRLALEGDEARAMRRWLEASTVEAPDPTARSA